MRQCPRCGMGAFGVTASGSLFCYGCAALLDVEQTVPSDPVLVTRKEREALVYVVQGMDMLKLAVHLGTAERTAKDHVSRLYRKLGADGRAEITLRAHRALAAPPEGANDGR